MGVGRSPVVPEKRALEDAPGPISAFGSLLRNRLLLMLLEGVGTVRLALAR